MGLGGVLGNVPRDVLPKQNNGPRPQRSHGWHLFAPTHSALFQRHTGISQGHPFRFPLRTLTLQKSASQ